MSVIKFGTTQALKRLIGWEPIIVGDKVYDIVIGKTDYETALRDVSKIIPGATIANPKTEEEFNRLVSLQQARDNEEYEFWVGLDEDGDGIVKHLCNQTHENSNMPINHPTPLDGFCIEYPVSESMITSNFITSDNKAFVTNDNQIFMAR